jgi:hypothetical protein
MIDVVRNETGAKLPLIGFGRDAELVWLIVSPTVIGVNCPAPGTP